MTDNSPHPSFSFHIESGEPEANVVPAAVLVQILENAQRAFELIGVHVEGRGIKERARVSSSTSQRFQLICQLPQAGCYAMPVMVGGAGELFSAELADKAFGIFRGVMERVSERSATSLSTILPDERIRRRVLESIKGMSPRADAKWKLSLHDNQNIPFATFDVATIPFVDSSTRRRMRSSGKIVLRLVALRAETRSITPRKIPTALSASSAETSSPTPPTITGMA